MNKPRFIKTHEGYYKNIDIGLSEVIYNDGYINKRNKTDQTFYNTRKDILRRDFQKTLFPIILLLKKRFKGEVMKVLDVGCGDGVILEALYDIQKAKKIKMDLYGIDPDKKALKDVRVPAQLSKGKAEKMKYKENFFHLITSSQTIEHFTREQVSQSNKEIYRILKKGGFYYIETPNPESLLARAMGRNWWMYLPDHQLLFPPKILAKILRNDRFKNIRARSRMEIDEQINEVREAYLRMFAIRNNNIARLGMFVLKTLTRFFNKGAVTAILAQK